MMELSQEVENSGLLARICLTNFPSSVLSCGRKVNELPSQGWAMATLLQSLDPSSAAKETDGLCARAAPCAHPWAFMLT